MPSRLAQNRRYQWMKFRRLSLEALPPVIGSLVVSCCIAPLAVIRWLQGDYGIAVIDTAVVLTLAFIVRMIYVKDQVRAASVILALLLMTASVVSVNLQGQEETVWMYPALAGMFFLLKLREAIVVSVIGIALTFSAFVEGLSTSQTLVAMLSLIVNAAVAAVFAAITNVHRGQLASAALLDSLTKIGNRRALDQSLVEKTRVARSDDQPLVLIMLDIDHFKMVNDTYGHAVGDLVLYQLAQTLRTEIRAGDECFRAGGEEFVVLSPNTTLEQAKRHAERLRKAIAELEFSQIHTQKPLKVTASIGMAEYRLGESTDALRDRADAALYEAKRSGRNRLYVIGRTGSLSGTGSHEVTLQINR